MWQHFQLTKDNVCGARLPISIQALSLLVSGLLVYLVFGLLRNLRSEMIRHSQDSAAIYGEFHEMRTQSRGMLVTMLLARPWRRWRCWMLGMHA